MQIIIDMVQIDTSPDVTFNITRGGTIVDLDGCSVDFIIKNKSTNLKTNTGHTGCTITSPAAGECVYTWITGDLPTSSFYECDLRITFPSAKQETKKIGITADRRV